FLRNTKAAGARFNEHAHPRRDPRRDRTTERGAGGALAPPVRRVRSEDEGRDPPARRRARPALERPPVAPGAPALRRPRLDRRPRARRGAARARSLKLRAPARRSLGRGVDRPAPKHDLSRSRLRRSFERNRRMRSADIAATSFAQRELELAARENELLRREAAVRHAEELLEDETMRRAQLEQRERELEQLRDALDAQRQRLDEVRAEYEARRDTLRLRAAELDAELEAIKLEQARAVAADLADVERNQPTEDVPPPLRVEAAGEWWARQLGAPLEAA